MSDEMNALVLAVDGGGTRCRVAAWGAHGVVCVETGSANVSTDFDGAVAEVRAGLEELAARLDLPVGDLVAAPAFVGLAGVTGPAVAERLRAALPFHHVRIEDDRVAAVRGVLGPRAGVLAHCGTGSFFAAQIAGEVRLSGGWGSVLGDEASAVWVGRRALGLALECVDGRREMSKLSQGLLDEMGGSAGIVAFAGKATPRVFGELAPRVTESAHTGDAVARAILADGAGEIARALRSLGWKTGQPVCLTGGIGPEYAAYLPEEMRACLREPEGTPLDGALALARDLAKEIVDERR